MTNSLDREIEEYNKRVGETSMQEVNHEFTDGDTAPKHYQFKVEPIDAIESWDLGFCLGNVVKYVARAGKKDSYMDDLRKARWYLDRALR